MTQQFSRDQREQQIIDFVARMREPDIVRPDEEVSLRYLVKLYGEAVEDDQGDADDS